MKHIKLLTVGGTSFIFNIDEDSKMEMQITQFGRHFEINRNIKSGIPEILSIFEDIIKAIENEKIANVIYSVNDKEIFNFDNFITINYYYNEKNETVRIVIG